MFETPKTNWVNTDPFNIEDYNRIKNNIQWVKDYSLNLYKNYETIDMGMDATYADLPYADMINTLENNLETIIQNTITFSAGETKSYGDNSPFIDYIELNRLEQACLKLYNLLTGQYHGRNKLSFKLNMKGVV